MPLQGTAAPEPDQRRNALEYSLGRQALQGSTGLRAGDPVREFGGSMRPEEAQAPRLCVLEDVEVIHSAEDGRRHDVPITKVLLPGFGLRRGIVLQGA